VYVPRDLLRSHAQALLGSTDVWAGVAFLFQLSMLRFDDCFHNWDATDSAPHQIEQGKAAHWALASDKQQKLFMQCRNYVSRWEAESAHNER
jgi:hypothetical protein